MARRSPRWALRQRAILYVLSLAAAFSLTSSSADVTLNGKVVSATTPAAIVMAGTSSSCLAQNAGEPSKLAALGFLS